MQSGSSTSSSIAIGVTSTSFSGVTGYNSTTLQSAIQGTWKSGCEGFYTATLVVSGLSMSETVYAYRNADCSDYYGIIASGNFTLTLGSANASQTDGYDLTASPAAAPYSVIKVNGSFLALGQTTQTLDGTTIAKRPNAWAPSAFIKQ